jgi:F-type H+-transporting ATPase subunit b
MRVRVLLAAFAVACAGVLAAPGVAFAQEEDEGGGEEELIEEAEHLAEENGATHADAECVAILIEGGEVDECHEAPNPILPEPNEIIWGGLAFIVLFLALLKFGLPAVRNMMKQREDRIRDDLERAEQAKTEAEGVLAQYEAQLADARAEAGRIIEESRQSADQVRRDLVAKAEADATEIRERAQQDVRLATQRATADLQSRMADLTIELAEKVVERSLDRDTQTALIESYIEQVGNGSR